MPLRIDSLQWPVTVLGFGRRIGIWFQGCTIGCPGCCARHTWPSDEGKLVSIADVLGWIEGRPLDDVDGVTITGGEPFEQPHALAQLVAALRRDVAFPRKIDVLCYSGLPWKRLQRDHRQVLAQLDVVIAEPFVQALPRRRLRGSANQTLHLLSELGRERYAGQSDEPHNALQIIAGDGEIRLVGIPGRGDMERIAKRLEEHGVTLGEASWR